MPNSNEARRVVVLLSRLIRWPLSEVLRLTFAEACAWLEEALAVEREIHRT